jgi:hypothetical protein
MSESRSGSLPGVAREGIDLVANRMRDFATASKVSRVASDVVGAGEGVELVAHRMPCGGRSTDE